MSIFINTLLIAGGLLIAALGLGILATITRFALDSETPTPIRIGLTLIFLITTSAILAVAIEFNKWFT